MNRTAVRLTRMSFIALAAAALAGCSMPPSADEAPIRVGTYNIRLSGGVSRTRNRSMSALRASRASRLAR